MNWLVWVGAPLALWALIAVVWFHPEVGFVLSIVAAAGWAMWMFAPVEEEVRVRAEDD